MDKNILNELKSIYTKITNQTDECFGLDLNRKNSSEWDSINHLHFILGIEQKFQVRFSLEEARNLNSIQEIYDAIEKKRNE